MTFTSRPIPPIKQEATSVEQSVHIGKESHLSGKPKYGRKREGEVEEEREREMEVYTEL